MGKYTEYLKEQKLEAANKEYQRMYSGELTIVLSRLLNDKDFRFYISDLIGFTNPFKTSFEEKGNVSSFNAGKQAVGLKIFNDIMAIAPEAFLELMKEEKARKNRYDAMLKEVINGESN